MITRKRFEAGIPYSHNVDIKVEYELELNKDIIKPGDILKIKGERGTFRFRQSATNSRTETHWIDCSDGDTGEFRSFHTDKIKNIVKPKKAKAKK